MKCRQCKRDIPDNSIYCNWCGKYQLKKPKGKVTVPKPELLPSGNWRVRCRKEGISVVLPNRDEAIAEATRQRKQWLEDEANGLHQVQQESLTLTDCIDKYIEARTPVLSVSTIRGYVSTMENHFSAYMSSDVYTLNTQDMINDDIAEGYTAKSTKNAWSIVSSALRYSKVPFDTPKLPRTVKPERNWLDYNQIQVFTKCIEGQSCELGALLALHSLRQSEIFGLRLTDYDKDKQILHIRGAMLRDRFGTWVRTDLNKNDTSQRDVPILIPRLRILLDAVPKSQEYIHPVQVNFYKKINAVCEAQGLPNTGLHGLRHSFASLAYHLEWKKLSTQKVGGWKNSKILDEIYTHNADLDSDLELMRGFYRGQKEDDKVVHKQTDLSTK